MNFLSSPSFSSSSSPSSQMDLLLNCAYSSLLFPSYSSMDLLNLATLLGQLSARPEPQLLPPLANSLLDPSALLALPLPPSLPCHGFSLLPTCSPPDFRAHLLLQLSPTAANGQSSSRTALRDFPLPSPSDTSSTGSSQSNEPSREDSEEKPIGGKVSGSSRDAALIRTHRLSYPREFKLVVLHSYWANGQNKYRTCKEFQITKSMLNGWLQKAEKIRNSRPGSLKSGRSGRRPQFPKIEHNLFELIRDQLARGEPVSNKWIRENARRLAQLELEDRPGREAAEGPTQCQFSERWLNNFKRRFGIQAQMGAKEGELGLGELALAQTDLEGEGGTLGEGPESLGEEELARIGREICVSSSTGQLPIRAFYERFAKMANEQAEANGGRAQS